MQVGKHRNKFYVLFQGIFKIAMQAPNKQFSALSWINITILDVLITRLARLTYNYYIDAKPNDTQMF